MSSRLPTSAVSRSVSSSIVRQNSVMASDGQSTSSASRLVTQALMLARGVRRSWETAARSAARSSSTRASASASARARATSADRRATVATNQATIPATTR